MSWGDAAVPCTVIDFSQGGAMVFSVIPIPLDRPVTLKFDDFLEFMAELIWQDGRQAGLCFHEPDWEGFKTYRH